MAEGLKTREYSAEQFFLNAPDGLRNSRLVVFIDVDGVLGCNLRPETKGLTDLKIKQLKNVGTLVGRLIKVKVICVPCTGLSSAIMSANGEENKSILKLTRMPVALCENGAVLVTNFGENSYYLGQKRERAILDKIRACLKGYEQREKETMVTVQIPKGKKHSLESREKFKDELLARLNPKLLKSLERLGIMASVSRNAVDFTSIDKGEGVEWFCQGLKMPLENRMAIGDSESDIPMMKVCKFAACPGNAAEKVRQYVKKLGDSGFATSKELREASGALKILTLVLRSFTKGKNLEDEFRKARGKN